MKMDIGCIRSILLELEKLPLGEYTFVERIAEVLPYSNDEVLYNCVKLCEAELIKATDYFWSAANIPHVGQIIDITYKGHQLLDSIRPQSTWEKIHLISEKTGLKSVTAIMEISDALLPETIKSALHSI